MNKIISINEYHSDDIYMSGYEVRTENDTYLMLIDNDQCCCENWGYMISEDDYKKFIGKELLSVELTDTALNKKMVKDEGINEDDYFDCGGIQFIDFKCANGGVFQIAVYNEHNGYYGHGVLFKKNDEILLDCCL